jgi:hypothetical protein
MFNTKTEIVKFDDAEFTITEPNVGELLAAMKLAQENPQNAIVALMRSCVSYQGATLGTNVEQLPGRYFRRISEAVAAIAGLGADEGNG